MKKFLSIALFGLLTLANAVVATAQPDVAISYRIKGQGPPVILIHGFAVSGEAN